MPSSSRPKASVGAPRPPTTTPMSERQQLALVMQLSSQITPPAPPNVSHGSARGRDRNERGETPLHVASIKGDNDKVRKLLDQGADPNITDFADSATSHRISQTGRSRDDNKKVVASEDTSAAGCGTNIMETLIKSTEDKNENKEPTVANSNDKSTASTVVAKNNEGESTTGAASNIVASSQEDSTVSVQKRNFAENTDPVETEVLEDDASKRKKRKEPEQVKETAKSTQQSRVNVGRGSISGNKPPGPASKTGVAPLSKGGGPLQTSGNKSSVGNSNQKSSTGSHGVTGQTKASANNSNSQGKSSTPGTQSGKSGSGQGKSQNTNLSIAQVSVKGVPDKKSPCASPKPSAFVKENEPDAEETKVDSSGPKVPPLKIVIPGGVGGGGASGSQQEGEGGSTQRGGTKNRGGSSTLPYIIHFNINAAGETVPVDGSEGWTESKDDKRQGGSEDKSSGSAQRVLRSHRNTDGERDKERGRSSPHVSATPCSPSGAPIPTKTPPPYHSSRQSPDTNDSGTDASNVTSGNNSGGGSSSSSGGSCGTSHSSASTSQQPSVELHPRKRKLKASKESHAHQSTSAGDSASGSSAESHSSSHVSPQNNPYQMYLNIKKQIERRQKGVFSVQPKPPQGFKDYLMNRCTYVLKSSSKQQPIVNPPPTIPQTMREEFIYQETDRHSLRVQHLVEKEKLVLAVEQEILRVHGRAARALANQELPFSVCTLLKDREVYNMLTPEQEEKERNAHRSRYNGRLFLSWLQDVDDKWEKIKEGMVRRHHTEAESLHATQKMSWEWKLKELGLCDHKTIPSIDQTHVPMVHVSDDFDLLPA